MASHNADRHERGYSGDRSQRAPISFRPPPSSAFPASQHARRAHPGGVITCIYPPGYDPHDRIHRFTRQRSASSTPLPDDTPRPGSRHPAASRVHRDSVGSESRLHGRLRADGCHQTFPFGLPPHLDSPGLDGDADDGQLLADSLDGPWPGYDPMGDSDTADDVVGGEPGRVTAVHQTPLAPRSTTASGGNGANSRAALDLGMTARGAADSASCAAAAAHGSMTADFEAGAPVAYVNNAPLRGYDAYLMQRCMEAEQTTCEPDGSEATVAAAAAKAIMQRGQMAPVRAAHALQVAEHPLLWDDEVAAIKATATFQRGDFSNGEQHQRRTAPAATAWLERNVRDSWSPRGPSMAGRQQHDPSVRRRLVIPEDWGSDDEPTIDNDGDDCAAPQDPAWRSEFSRLGDRAEREVHVRSDWNDAVHSSPSNGVARRIVHAPKQLGPGTRRVVTALQTFRQPKSKPATQPAARKTTSKPAHAPPPKISVEDRLDMSLDSIVAQQKVGIPATAASAGRGGRGRGQRGRGVGRYVGERGIGDEAAQNRGTTRHDMRGQQSVAVEQTQNERGAATLVKKRAVETVLAPAEKLNMSLDQIQKRQRV